MNQRKSIGFIAQSIGTNTKNRGFYFKQHMNQLKSSGFTMKRIGTDNKAWALIIRA